MIRFEDPLATQNSISLSVKRHADNTIISVWMTETHSPVTGFHTYLRSQPKYELESICRWMS